MKNKFNSNLYKKEITNLIKLSIEKLKIEYPNYEVLTMSITSDFSSGISAIHFDSESFSKNYLQKEKYKYYLEKNEIMWGDCGIANFFIREKDLKELNFDKVIYNCCLLYTSPSPRD